MSRFKQTKQINPNIDKIVKILEKYLKKKQYKNYTIEDETNGVVISDDEFNDYCFKFQMEIQNLPLTCTMFELSMNDSYYTNRLKDLENYIYFTITKTDLIAINSLLLKNEIEFEYLSDKYRTKDTLITNVIKDTDEHKIVAKSGVFKKVYSYQGNEGEIWTYMLKR